MEAADYNFLAIFKIKSERSLTLLSLVRVLPSPLQHLRQLLSHCGWLNKANKLGRH
jgi:hypothetical protein